MTPDNKTGNENTSSPENSQQEDSFPSSSVLNDRLNKLLWDDESAPQTEEGEADSNQPEDQQSESEPETDTNPDTEGEEVHSKSEGEQEEVSRGVQKRIDKLTAKRMEAEATIAQLKTELETAKNAVSAKPVSEDRSNAFSNIDTIAEIEAEIAQARSVRNWADENADGITITDKEGNEEYFDPAKLRQIKVNATRALEEGLPERYKYIQTRDQIETVAMKEYSWWKDSSSKEKQIAESFLRAFPQIKKFPDYKMVIGDYIRGVKARENGRSQTTISKAPVQPRSSGVAPTVQKQEVRSQNAYAKFAKSGRTEDLTDIIMNKFL